MSEEVKDQVENQDLKEELSENEEVNGTTNEEINENSSEKKGKTKSSKKKEEEPVEDELEELKEKNEDLRDKYLRLFADFDNYKKRVAKEKLALLNEAGKEVILDMIPVLDDFERSIKTMEESEDVAALKEGSLLICNKLKKALEQKGLKEMVSIGENFDPEFHEAITEIPAPSKEQKGKVIDEVEKGYSMGKRIIRYAKVVVGK